MQASLGVSPAAHSGKGELPAQLVGSRVWSSSTSAREVFLVQPSARAGWDSVARAVCIEHMLCPCTASGLGRLGRSCQTLCSSHQAQCLPQPQLCPHLERGPGPGIPAPSPGSGSASSDLAPPGFWTRFQALCFASGSFVCHTLASRLLCLLSPVALCCGFLRASARAEGLGSDSMCSGAHPLPIRPVLRLP